ncbi:VWA domain-containing protein [Fundidesulfovibrio agrisoli]|uniref:VWA domain-containing protein n=1 Tax=Fundidesulfovibrio agrisoli TaxID=2922717 RepID=UPI001FAD707A|nr:VWA domain-containing protein [Fundidesulfovibrio agrisoli]
MFTFAHIWLLAVLPLPLVVRWLSRPYREERPAVLVPFFDELAALSGQTPGDGAVVRAQTLPRQIVASLCWLLLVVAMARPQWVEPPIVREIPTRDVLLGVDLSSSMETEDFTTADGRKSTRLDAVKGVLDDFLKRRKGDRVGLIFFGTAPFIQAPFTEDLETCRELLREAQVGMAGPRTAIGDAIGVAINMFKASTVKDKLLILLTDGNDSSSRLAPEKAAAIAKDERIVIYTVAVGDPTAVGEQKLDVRTLKDVAATTGGSYFWAGDGAGLENIYKDIDKLGTHQVQSVSYRPKADLYHWPLGAALLLSMLLHAGRIARTRGAA